MMHFKMSKANPMAQGAFCDFSLSLALYCTNFEGGVIFLCTPGALAAILPCVNCTCS